MEEEEEEGSIWRRRKQRIPVRVGVFWFSSLLLGTVEHLSTVQRV
jgi:hypothetical protein